MNDYRSRERLSELWRRIDEAHFVYLESDDSPEKLVRKKKLEALAREYLCAVPHAAKFFLQETGRVFAESAERDPDFSGYRSARGWAAIAAYAANLLAQPWRKEYATLRPYCGYFKHEIEGSGLRGADAMLRVMGYRADASGGGGAYVLDGPVCPDRVAAVSRDALIARVECRLMVRIWEEAAVRGEPRSWADVARCRARSPGDVETAVRALLAPDHDPSPNPYCNVDFEPSADRRTNGHRPPPAAYAVPFVAPYPPPYAHPPYANGYACPVIAPQPYYYYPSYVDDRHAKLHHCRDDETRNGAPRSSVSTLPRSDTQPSLSKAREDGTGTYESWDYVYRKLESHRSALDRESKTLGRTAGNGGVPGRDPKKHRPVAMDLEDALRAKSLERDAEEDAFRTAKINEALAKKRQESEAKAARASAKRATADAERATAVQYDSPQIVYQDYGATDKTRLIPKEDAKSKKEMDKEVFGHHNGRSKDKAKNHKSSSGEIEKIAKKKTADQGAAGMARTSHGTSASNSLSSQNQASSNCDAPDWGPTRLVVSLDGSEIGTSAKNPPSDGSAKKKWECGTCTYLNGEAAKACEMCGKSKQPGPETLPLMSGGKECPQCTFVNQRQASVCEMCNESLKNSPTYI